MRLDLKFGERKVKYKLAHNPSDWSHRYEVLSLESHGDKYGEVIVMAF